MSLCLVFFSIYHDAKWFFFHSVTLVFLRPTENTVLRAHTSSIWKSCSQIQPSFWPLISCHHMTSNLFSLAQGSWMRIWNVRLSKRNIYCPSLLAASQDYHGNSSVIVFHPGWFSLDQRDRVMAMHFWGADMLFPPALCCPVFGDGTVRERKIPDPLTTAKDADMWHICNILRISSMQCLVSPF